MPTLFFSMDMWKISGEKMSLKEEIVEISKWMYQNCEQQSFEWVAKNLDIVKEVMIQVWEDKYLGSGEAKEVLLELLKKLIDAYNRQDILALGDILRYEIAEFI